MVKKKNILAIIGSASSNSSNEKLVENMAVLTKDFFNLTLFTDLKDLPHFDPELSIENTPKKIVDFRNLIDKSDGVIICTPEYVFSIPSGLKNAIEWTVSTTVFSEKPIGLITASANGEKGHEELQLIMKTLTAQFNSNTTLLINGIKGKITTGGKIIESKLKKDLDIFIKAFVAIL